MPPPCFLVTGWVLCCLCEFIPVFVQRKHPAFSLCCWYPADKVRNFTSYVNLTPKCAFQVVGVLRFVLFLFFSARCSKRTPFFLFWFQANSPGQLSERNCCTLVNNLRSFTELSVTNANRPSCRINPVFPSCATPENSPPPPQKKKVGIKQNALWTFPEFKQNCKTPRVEKKKTLLRFYTKTGILQVQRIHVQTGKQGLLSASTLRCHIYLGLIVITESFVWMWICSATFTWGWECAQDNNRGERWR